MNRIKASASHFLLSLVIFSIVICILVLFWFPAPYFTASGGWQGLKIAASVDLVLGPLLTLVVFDVRKPIKTILGDLMVIALVQFSALAWGINTIYQQRPVAVAFFESSFYTVPASALTSQYDDLEKLKLFGNQKPVFIYVEKPATAEGLTRMLDLATKKGIAPHHQIELYRSLKSYYPEIKDKQTNIDEIIAENVQIQSDLMEILAKSDAKIDDYDYYPLRSKYHNIILMFDHEAKLIDHISVPHRE